jgi:predicted outer membrane protein
MPVRCRMRFSVAAIAIPCLMAGVGLGQQENQQDTQSRPSARERDASGQPGARQSDRATTQQDGQNSTQVSPRTRQSAQQYTANPTGAASTGETSHGVEQFAANCLLIKNQMEIELSQFAAQQSQNPEVKQFAQQMVQDHQKMVQQLQEIAGAQNDGARGPSSPGLNSQSGRGGATTSSNNSNRLNGTGGSTSREAGGISGGASGSNRLGAGATAASANNPDLGAATGQSRSLPGSSGTNTQPQASGKTRSGSAISSDGTIQQLIQMNQQIAQRQGQAAREDLQQKSGAEFDKCFVGTAIMKHTDMVAELEVIEQQGQGRLAQVAQQARPVAQQHLDHAKQLMKQLEGQSLGGTPNGRNPRQATRSQP